MSAKRRRRGRPERAAPAAGDAPLVIRQIEIGCIQPVVGPLALVLTVEVEDVAGAKTTLDLAVPGGDVAKFQVTLQEGIAKYKMFTAGGA